MADEDLVEQFRLVTGIPEGDLSDEDLETLLDANGGSIERTAQSHFERQAYGYSQLVDVTESGSSRSMSQLFKNSAEMGRYWASKANDNKGVVTRVARTRTARREDAV